MGAGLDHRRIHRGRGNRQAAPRDRSPETGGADQTVRKLGYVFEVPERRAAAEPKLSTSENESRP